MATNVTLPRTQSQPLIIDGINIRQEDGLYSLNDLHKAAGGENKHRPVYFLDLEQTKGLVESIKGRNPDLLPVLVVQGRNGGTYVCKQLVIAYAMWISPEFNLKVINFFLDNQKVVQAMQQYTRHLANAENVPHGYFSIIAMTHELIIYPLERRGGMFKDGACPDGSVGKLFKAWLEEQGIDTDVTVQYLHKFPERKPPYNEFMALAWPDSYAGYARQYINSVWIGERLVPYLKKSKQEWLIPLAQDRFSITLDKKKQLT